MWCHGPLSLFFCNDMYICTISRHRRWKFTKHLPFRQVTSLYRPGYWRALLLHHGHRNKIVGMGVHKVLLLVVPQSGGPAQGERSRGTIQPYKKVTLAPRPAPPAPSWLHIQTSFWLIPRSSPVFGRIHDCVMCQKDVCICTFSDTP